MIILTFLGYFISSCESSGNKQNLVTHPKKEVVKDSGDQISKIDTLALIINNEDSIPTHTLKKGETLWELGKVYYGNRHYSSLIIRYNEIKNVESIEAGTPINIPSLHTILTDKKFNLSIIKNEIDLILKARGLYMEIESQLWDLRRKSNWKGKQKLSQNLKNKLLEAASLIDESVNSLQKFKSKNIAPPYKMINWLKTISRDLKKLASGSNDGYGYDLDMIHQNLIRTFLRAFSWAEQEIQ